MKLLKDITTIFIILFTSIIALGAIVVLLKAIFVSLSNLFVCIVLVLVVSAVYSLGRLIVREYK
jgi:hypothetical protein